MTVTGPAGVSDTDWIKFDSTTRTVSYAKNLAGYDGDYSIYIYGYITN